MKPELKERIIRLYEITTGERIYKCPEYYYAIDEKSKKITRIKWRVIRANYDTLVRAKSAIKSDKEVTLEEIALSVNNMLAEESEK